MTDDKLREACERVAKRIEDKVMPVPMTGCWIWLGPSDKPDGYGRISLNGKSKLAHRVSYEAFVGQIPKGLQIDHLCRVKPCVNPQHLEPVTPYENSRRGETLTWRVKRTTHCPKGHPYSGKNLYITKRNGWRYCRACIRERWQLKNATKKQPEKTHCPYGHPYSGDNLRISSQGWRICRECKRTKQRERRKLAALDKVEALDAER